MRRLLHFVARLYPETWQRRHGAEFTALLEDIRPQWTDVFDILKGGIMSWLKRSKIAGILALAGAAWAFAATYWSPLHWTSGANVHARADDAGISDYVRELSQRALSTSFLAEVIRDYNLYPKEQPRTQSPT